MKPGDRVRIRKVLPVEWPEFCADHDAFEPGLTGVVVGVDSDGPVVVMLDGVGDDWTGWDDDDDGEPRIPCLVLPAAALEPVPPPLPDGWTVERLGGCQTLLHMPGSLRIAARVEGGVLTLCPVASGAPADLIAALAHLLAVAVPTVATGGELHAVTPEVTRG